MGGLLMLVCDVFMLLYRRNAHDDLGGVCCAGSYWHVLSNKNSISNMGT